MLGLDGWIGGWMILLTVMGSIASSCPKFIGSFLVTGAGHGRLFIKKK
jgi:hypothetical protein